MTQVLEKPEEIKVNTNIEGTPLIINRNGKTERVTRIYHHWHVSEQLWSQEILKNYFRVRTNNGPIYDIYRNVTSNVWYLGKIHI